MEEQEQKVEEAEEKSSDDVSSDISSLEEEEISEEEKKDGKVAYSRFKRIHSRMKEAEAKADELKGELEYYRSLSQAQPEIPSATTEVETEEDFNWEKPRETVKAIVEKTLQQQLPQILATEVRKEKARTEALDRFPELANPNSQFFKQTAYQLERLGLTKHPEGVLLAASVVAATQMPETLGRMKAREEELRKKNLGFVEGSQKKPSEEELVFSSEDESLLDKLGISPNGKKEIARRLAGGK